MLTIWQLQKNLQEFDIWAEVVASIIATRMAIAELVRGQLFLGKRPDDSELPPYSPWYADLKSQLSGIAGITERRTLYLTGAFWRSIDVDVNSETFIVKSDDPKADMIFRREGDVLGLSQEGREKEYIPLYFFPELKDRIEKKLQLKIA